MKKLVLFLTIMFMTMSYGQETKQIPLINVNGEGKVKVAPDQVCISATVETNTQAMVFSPFWHRDETVRRTSCLSSSVNSWLSPPKPLTKKCLTPFLI